jgi:dUTP pyrophosphatase
VGESKKIFVVMNLRVQKLYANAKLPERARADDAGLDLFCQEEVVLLPGERKAIGTGIAMGIPSGYAGLIWDKSGVALKSGLKSMGGVIDAQYRGEVKVIMVNWNTEPATLEVGQKIAQILIQKIELPGLVATQTLDDTDRGEAGFGSSGLN